jgi:pilus assembly protein Flp/PilA
MTPASSLWNFQLSRRYCRRLSRAKFKEQKMRALLHLLRDDQGATAVEYGLIVAAIAGLIIAVVSVLGGKINNTFNNIQAAL